MAIKRILDKLSFLHGNVLVLTITQSTGMFVRSMAFPYASLYILALGGEASQVGWVNSLRPLAGLLMFPIAGHLADLTGRVRLIALAGYYSGLVMLLYVLAPSWEAIALAGLLQGLAVFQFPPTSALLADSLSPQNRGRGIATMRTISGFTAILAPYLAGAILTHQGTVPAMRALYGAMAATYLLNAMINARFLRETSSNAHVKTRLADLPGLFKGAYQGIPETIRLFRGPLLGLSGVLILGFIANSLAGPFWVVYALDHIGLSSTQWGLILLIECLLRNLAYLPAGWLVDHWSRTACLRGALILSLLSLPFFPFVRGVAGALAVRCAAAVGTALVGPACTALMADMVSREQRGRVMAAIGRGTMMIGASSGGGAGGPGLGFLTVLPVMAASIGGGYLYEWNPIAPWVAVLAATLVASVLAWFVIRDPARAEA
jgi:MFS family permease